MGRRLENSVGKEEHFIEQYFLSPKIIVYSFDPLAHKPSRILTTLRKKAIKTFWEKEKMQEF